MAMTMGAKSKPHMTIGARLEAHMRQREKKVGAWLEEGEREDKGRKELKQRRRGCAEEEGGFVERTQEVIKKVLFIDDVKKWKHEQKLKDVMPPNRAILYKGIMNDRKGNPWILQLLRETSLVSNSAQKEI